MGKIKTKLIKRTSRVLITKDLDFSEDFEKNKKILGIDMPSKKVRNQIAGYLARMRKMQRMKQEEIEKSLIAAGK